MSAEQLGMLERLSHVAQGSLRGLKVRSALNPAVLLCGVTMPLCFGAAYVFRSIPTLALVLVLFGLLPLTVACIGFLFFMLKRPQLLQSEDFQLRHQSMEMLQVRLTAPDADPRIL